MTRKDLDERLKKESLEPPRAIVPEFIEIKDPVVFYNAIKNLSRRKV